MLVKGAPDEYIFQNVFSFSLISEHWDDTGSWNPSPWKTRIQLSCMVNIVAADDLGRPGARTSADVLRPNGCKDICWCSGSLHRQVICRGSDHLMIKYDGSHTHIHESRTWLTQSETVSKSKYDTNTFCNWNYHYPKESTSLWVHHH